MTYDPELIQKRIINRFIWLSQKHHKLSLLFYELSQSLRLEAKKKNLKEFKKHLKELNLDINKIMLLTSDMKELSLNDIQKDKI